MATSFAAYASQFLNRQQNGASSLSSSQPMFFSFTTDDGSRAGHSPDGDLDDLDDPHLRTSDMSRGAHYHNDNEDDDPYLRLDEDEHHPGSSRIDSRDGPPSLPLIASEQDSELEESPKGWLAHQVSPLRASRSPSPSPSRSSDASPPPDLFVPAPARVRHPSPPPPTGRTPISLSLTESLLPRDGYTRPLDVFSLPDPRHTRRGRRKYNDHIWTAIWCTGVSVCAFFSILILFLIHKPDRRGLPYTTLLHTVPMLTILTFLSAAFSYLHIFLLRVFVRPVMIATSVFIPATLFVSAIWAFVGSFMWDTDVEPTWGETVGLRLFSIIPLILSLLTARRLLNLPREIHTTSSTLTLTTHLLIANPFLLALSPTILLITLLASIPFLTLIFRLLLIGYFSPPLEGSSATEWHVSGWANWAITGTIAIWLWSWGVARGLLRMTCAGVIGAWYFADPDALPPSPTSTHTIHAALTRSTGTSLGTIVLSALLLTIIRMLSLLTMFLQRLPLYIPARAFFVLSGIRMAVGFLESATTALSKYALVYAGLTGDAFMPSARRAKALTSAVDANSGRFGRRRLNAEPPLTLLTFAPLSLTFPFALATYLFAAHTLNAPDQALGAAMLAGGVTALVGLFCVGLVKDIADTLFICYCIDKDMGERRREEVFLAFEYRSSREHARSHPSQPTSPPLQSHPHFPGHVHSPQHPQPPQRQQRQQAHPESRQQQPRHSISPPAAAPPASSSSHKHRLAVQEPLVDDDMDPFARSDLRDNSQLLHNTLSPTRLQTQQLQTSAELNMKRNSEVLPYSVSPELSGSGHEMNDSDDDGDGSQFFPGSGLFKS